jgi:hypothetical protein
MLNIISLSYERNNDLNNSKYALMAALRAQPATRRALRALLNTAHSAHSLYSLQLTTYFVKVCKHAQYT